MSNTYMVSRANSLCTNPKVFLKFTSRQCSDSLVYSCCTWNYKPIPVGSVLVVGKQQHQLPATYLLKVGTDTTRASIRRGHSKPWTSRARSTAHPGKGPTEPWLSIGSLFLAMHLSHPLEPLTRMWGRSESSSIVKIFPGITSCSSMQF